MEQIFNFEGSQYLSLENSFGVIKEQSNVLLVCTIGIKDKNYGWFECYDKKTKGDNWYVSGGLWFQNGNPTDYDGCFSMPTIIVDKLRDMGYDVTEIE